MEVKSSWLPLCLGVAVNHSTNLSVPCSIFHLKGSVNFPDVNFVFVKWSLSHRPLAMITDVSKSHRAWQRWSGQG